jgi:integrase
MKGTGGVYRRGTLGWCHFSSEGRVFRKSTGVPVGNDEKLSKLKAEKFLLKQIGKRGAAENGGKRLQTAKEEKITINQLLNDYTKAFCTDRKGNRREVSSSMLAQIRHVREFCGNWLAKDLGPEQIANFKTDRLAAGLAPASVNRCLQHLGRAFRIGAEFAKVTHVPVIKLYVEDNVRKGKLSRAQMEQIASCLPAHLADAVRFAFETGTRRSELFGLRWTFVDDSANVIRVPAALCKNDEDRVIAITPAIQSILARRRAAKIPNSDLIFTKTGKLIRDPRKQWQRAAVINGLGVFHCRYCTGVKLDLKNHCPQCGENWGAAGHKTPLYRGVLLHDLRRSMAFELIAAGVSIEGAMKTIGHRTPEMTKRYAVFSEVQSRDFQLRAQEQRAKFFAKEQDQTSRQHAYNRNLHNDTRVLAQFGF